MPRLITAMLVRNEAGPDRYLRRVLARCQEFSDAIVVLDDRSTDLTARVCREYGAIVKTRSVLDSQAWGAESAARSELWQLALEHCGEDGWVLFADADMILRGDPRPLMGSRDVNAWAWPLYDLWSETEYREDQYWIGHRFPRIWMVKPISNGQNYDTYSPDWSIKGLHSGHVHPMFDAVAGLAPPDIYWEHWGWSQEQHRKAKFAQYMSQAHQLNPFEVAHVRSILDPQEPA